MGLERHRFSRSDPHPEACDRSAPFPSKAKLLEIVSFFRRSIAAELVTISAACMPDNCADAAQALWATMGGGEPENTPR